MLVVLLSLVWGWRTGMFQLSGFYCMCKAVVGLLLGPVALTRSHPRVGGWQYFGARISARYTWGNLCTAS